jgi:tRNA-dihydrouridine synthase
VLVSGGLHSADKARAAFEQTGAAGVLLARGSLGNPWLFSELLGGRDGTPSALEVLDELDWVIERAVEHLGEERATRFLRKFYPWYVERLALDDRVGERALQASLQTAPTLGAARALVRDAVAAGAAAG